ncbi:DNA/RNA non-specific endonuclease [Streptomonospora nanhaiensis]|uniref:DNA/RNA non-specific endonuclease n=1 Tax=Streptomonospora nanhaiensis TaxID=1323731 RepID=UPI003622A548
MDVGSALVDLTWGSLKDTLGMSGFHDGQGDWTINPATRWENAKAYWGDSLAGIAMLAGYHDGEFSLSTARTAWTEVGHSMVPWREWDDRPGYVITQGLVNVGSIVGGAIATATGAGAVVGVPLLAWRGTRVVRTLSNLGDLGPGRNGDGDGGEGAEFTRTGSEFDLSRINGQDAPTTSELQQRINEVLDVRAEEIGLEAALEEAAGWRNRRPALVGAPDIEANADGPDNPPSSTPPPSDTPTHSPPTGGTRTGSPSGSETGPGPEPSGGGGGGTGGRGGTGGSGGLGGDDPGLPDDGPEGPGDPEGQRPEDRAEGDPTDPTDATDPADPTDPRADDPNETPGEEPAGDVEGGDLDITDERDDGEGEGDGDTSQRPPKPERLDPDSPLWPEEGKRFGEGVRLDPNTRYELRDCRDNYASDADYENDRPEVFITNDKGEVVEVHTRTDRENAQNPELMDPRPNATYVVDDRYTYRTDHLGRTESMEGVLELDSNARNDTQQRAIGWEGRDYYKAYNKYLTDQFTAQHGRSPNPGELPLYEDVNWNGGHMAGASEFGGGGERLNVVPMLETVNQKRSHLPGIGGSFRRLEEEWVRLLKQDPKPEVRVRITNVYDPNMPTLTAPDGRVLHPPPTDIFVEWEVNGVKHPSPLRYRNSDRL